MWREFVASVTGGAMPRHFVHTTELVLFIEMFCSYCFVGVYSNFSNF